jgi:hypothetical protein
MPLSSTVPKLITGQLDANGAMTATAIFNDALITSQGLNTTYQLTIKDQGGGQVWNETYFFTGTAANLSLVLPSGAPSPPFFVPQGAILASTVSQLSTTQIVSMPVTGDLIIEATGNMGGGIALTMPSAIGLTGRKISIIMVDTGTGGVYVNPATGSGQTFSGNNTIHLTNQWQMYTIASDGLNWVIVASYG